MQLFELFDNPLPYDVTADTSSAFQATFEDPDGNPYEFDAEMMHFAPEFKDAGNTWMVGFDTEQGGERTDATIGGRKSIPIFSTVLDMVKRLVAEKGANELYFESDSTDTSRLSLYRKIAQVSAKQLGWQLNEVPHPNGHAFIVSRPGSDMSKWTM